MAKQTAKTSEINRLTHEIDATDQSVGRLSTHIAKLLMGKHKPTYEPRIDGGDRVMVSNVEKVKFTGNKVENKYYYHYSGYPGGLKKTQLKAKFEKNPQEVLRVAVWNMLPKNKLRSEMIKRLKFSK